MQSVRVTLSETYDLSTRLNKLGCVGVHTPGRALIKAQWPGLWQNFRRVHLDSCRVVLACASSQPVDPLQVGTTGDVVAPQDMFNPLLYRAVSNDSFNLIQERIRTIGGNSFPNGSIDNTSDLFSGNTATTQERIYYNLLSDKSWRKAMPQAGFVMDGLYPIVYEVVNSYGGGAAVLTTEGGQVQMTYDVGMGNYVPQIGNTGGNNGNTVSAGTSARAPFTMRGSSKRMPSVPIHNGPEDSDASNIPVSYVAIIVTPPGKKNVLYYRLKVEWTISFHGLIPLSEYSTTALQAANYVYGSDYSIQSKDADDKLGMADSFEADMEQVM